MGRLLKPIEKIDLYNGFYISFGNTDHFNMGDLSIIVLKVFATRDIKTHNLLFKNIIKNLNNELINLFANRQVLVIQQGTAINICITSDELYDAESQTITFYGAQILEDILNILDNYLFFQIELDEYFTDKNIMRNTSISNILRRKLETNARYLMRNQTKFQITSHLNFK